MTFVKRVFKLKIMVKLRKIFFICLINIIFSLFFAKEIRADFCNSTGCWSSVICGGKSYTLHCSYDCTCPASPCQDNNGRCVSGTATSDAGCDANGNPYISCNGCSCGGGGGGGAPIPTSTPTACPTPPAPTLKSPTDGSKFILGPNFYLDLQINQISQKCGANNPQYWIEFIFPSGGSKPITYQSGWIGVTSWHTGPYLQTGEAIWKAKARYYDTYYSTYRESGWSLPWKYFVITPTPTPTPTLTPTPTPSLSTPLPNWFQTQEGDVHSNGDIIAKIPENNFFSLRGEGGFPGVVSSFNQNPYFSQGGVSEKDWLAAGLKDKRRYDYSYFNTLLEIPQENVIINNGILPSSLVDDKINNQLITSSPFWKIEGDLEVESLNNDLGVKVFLVSGNLTFKNDLNLQNTLPVFISQGDIEIKPQVHTLTGVLISSGEINTGKAKEEKTFILNGAAIGKNFSLERERETNSQPAEFFTYNPKIPLSLVSFLGKSSHLWEELAP